MPRSPAPAPGGQGRSTAVDRVVHLIREGVKRGRYAPGQRLPEADLTRDLKVSRGPLREALSRLAAEGVLEIEPYRGAMVRRLTRRDVEDLYQVREVLEGQAAALAARRIGDGDAAERLKKAMVEVADWRGSSDPNAYAYMDSNAAFHSLIISLASNQVLADLMAQLRTNAFRLQLVNVMRINAREASIREHEEVAAAILAGDARKAERTMRRHVRHSYQAVMRVSDDLFG
jgi:DNA-binding GntR family transcriptional regulator